MNTLVCAICNKEGGIDPFDQGPPYMCIPCFTVRLKEWTKDIDWVELMSQPLPKWIEDATKWQGQDEGYFDTITFGEVTDGDTKNE